MLGHEFGQTDRSAPVWSAPVWSAPVWSAPVSGAGAGAGADETSAIPKTDRKKFFLRVGGIRWIRSLNRVAWLS
jgi:hypothetical protein